MPIINGVTTKSIKQIWQSPDGQRTINEVTMEYEGKLFKANTFSNDIAAIGWSGDVESYDKPGRNGSQTFVKQAPKDESLFVQGGGAKRVQSGNSYQPKDEKAIQAMWAIRQSISAHSGSADMDVADLSSVEGYAKELMAMVDRIKVGGQTDDAQDTEPSKPDVVIEDIENEPLDLSGIEEVLGGTQKVSPEESPWKRS